MLVDFLWQLEVGSLGHVAISSIVGSLWLVVQLALYFTKAGLESPAFWSLAISLGIALVYIPITYLSIPRGKAGRLVILGADAAIRG